MSSSTKLESFCPQYVNIFNDVDNQAFKIYSKWNNRIYFNIYKSWNKESFDVVRNYPLELLVLILHYFIYKSEQLMFVGKKWLVKQSKWLMNASQVPENSGDTLRY